MKSIEQFSKKVIISLILLFSITSVNAQCDWEAVGPDDDMFFIEDSSTIYKPAIASDNNGVQYVAFTDGEHNAKISVKRFVNDHWTYLGVPGFSAGKADLVEIATDNLNRVYVAYQDYANNRKLTVQFYNGFSWSVIGTLGLGNDTVIALDLAVDNSTNRPLVYLKDSVNVATVMEFDGNNWNVLGASNFVGMQIYEARLSSYNGTPYMVYTTYGPNTLGVKYFNGTAWTTLGNVPSSFTNSYWASAITIDNNNIPHVAFIDGSASSQLSVMYLNAGTWNYLGSPGIVSYTGWYVDLAFDQSNNAYVAFSKTGTRAEIVKYNGISWNLASSYYTPNNVYITSQYAYYRGMTLDKLTGHLYMLYTERTASPLHGWRDFGVMKFDGTKTFLTGSQGATGTLNNAGSIYSCFDFDKFGTPYVAYADSAVANRISVKKYVNGSWVFVGTPGFNGGVTEFVQIAFDTTGVPYVSYREANNDLYIMKFNGTAWVQVGVMIPAIYNTSIAINPVTNEPYVFYDDTGNGLRGNVIRFNGSSWVNVGAANFTPGSAAYNNLVFDNAGTPIVAYSDNSSGTKAIVKRFNGSTWVTVGAGYISAAQAHSLKLKIDAQNNLYVVYTDQANGYKALCYKYNGTAWSALGSFVSGGYTSDVDVVADNAGNVFVYYNEQYLNYYPGTVRRFFNNAWIPVGRQYISNSSCQSNQIQLNPVSGLPFIGSVTSPGVLNSTLSKCFYLKSLPCNFGSALMGQVVYDANSNCVNDPTEQKLNNQPVKLSQGTNVDLSFTDYMGQYYFTANPIGTYTVGMGNLANGYNVSCAASLPHQTNIVANTLTIEDFSIACTPAFDIIANSISPIGNWWPGQVVKMWTHVSIQKTVCNGAVTPGEIRLIFPPCLKFQSDTTLPWQPDSVSIAAAGDTIWYYVPDVYSPSPYLYNSLLTTAKICTTATATDTLCIELMVSALNDVNLLNNTYARCIPIAASYDPNNKEVSPKGINNPGYIPASTVEMLYTIHFQNTGTAPAVNVSVKDTMSQNLDLNTFEIVSSSHSMQGNTLTNGVMTFNFPNIMLPDSSVDLLNSMGYITYKINLKPTLAPLTEIKNTAYIYFDYNSPIITNTTLNTIENIVGIKSNSKLSDEFVLYPNPAITEITVLATKEIKWLRINNALGEVVINKQNLNAKQLNLNIESLRSGIYFIELYTGDKLSVMKFVKN